MKKEPIKNLQSKYFVHLLFRHFKGMKMINEEKTMKEIFKKFEALFSNHKPNTTKPNYEM